MSFKNVREAMAAIQASFRDERILVEDPMTQYYGVASDFRPLYTNRRRNAAAYIIAKSPIDSRRWKYAIDVIQEFLP